MAVDQRWYLAMIVIGNGALMFGLWWEQRKTRALYKKYQDIIIYAEMLCEALEAKQNEKAHYFFHKLWDAVKKPEKDEQDVQPKTTTGPEKPAET